MKIVLNGKDFEAKESWTVQDLLVELELPGKRLALMMDDEIVSKTKFSETHLAENCSVEIIQMVGGG